MSQIAAGLLAVNLWALIVCAAAIGLSRAMRSLAFAPAYWTSAVALVILPWLAGPLVPPAVAPHFRAGVSRLIDAQAPTVAAGPTRSAASRLAAARPVSQTVGEIRALSVRRWIGFGVAAVVVAYAAGALRSVGLLVAAHLRLRWLARRAQRLPTTVTCYPVHLVEGPTPPCALGFPRPCVLLPTAMPETIGASGIAMILRHEEAHIERRDPETTLLVCLVGALLWPNPAMRAVIDHWRLAAEMRADAAVISASPMEQRRHYAQLLVAALREGRAAVAGIPSAVLRLDPKGSIKLRLSAIINADATRDCRFAVLAAAVVGSVLAASGALGAAMLIRSQDPSTVIAPRIAPIHVDLRVGGTAARQPLLADAGATALASSLKLAGAPDAVQSAVSGAPPAQIADAPAVRSPEPVPSDTLADVDIRCWGGSTSVLAAGTLADPPTRQEVDGLCRAIGTRETVRPGDPNMRSVPIRLFTSNGILYLGDPAAALPRLRHRRDLLAAQLDSTQSRQGPGEAQQFESLSTLLTTLDREIAIVAAYEARPQKN